MEIRLVHDVDVSTLHSILSSSTIFSKRNTGIILEQELAAYEEMCYKNIERCPKMQMEITEILLQDIYITPDPESRFLKAQTLVRKGKALRVCGVDGLRDCIECLSKAIIIMNEIEISGEMCSKAVPIYHQLGVTHCLRALCTQEAEPNSKRILEDVKAALKIWLNISYVDCNEEGNFYTLSDNIMVLLYNLLDLIQSKGFMELSNDAYQLLIRMFKLKSISVEKWLTLLWESRRLSHALCVLPVNEAFILKSQEFCELSTINSWIHNLQGNQSSLLDFQHNFSFLFANSRLNSCDDNRYFQTDITVEEVQKVARKLISNVSPKIESTFVAGYLYRDLSQRLMTNGRLIEALSFANETRDLHTNLFHSKFTRVRKQNEEPINIEVKKSAAREVMLFDSISRDLNDRYLSPWKVLQGFLESILQLGLIYEMMGNRTQAVPYFRWGWAISDSFQFPLFTFAFSSHLGGVYVKEGHWDSAEKELQCAKDILNSSSAFCCSKCLIVLEVTLYESLGDLYRTKPNNTCERHVSKEAVKKWYTPALEKLILAESRNGLSFPEEGSDETATGAKCAASKTCSCSIMNEAGEDIMKSMKRAPETKISGYQSLQNQHTGISNKSEANESVEENLVFDSSGMLNQKESVLKHFSNMRCWHCLPSEVLKSGLLYDLINLKWEFVRRKLSMKLLTQVVKCLESYGQIDEVREILLQNISLLVGRNRFRHTFSSIQPELFHDLVVKAIPEDVFTIERAVIIHDICWYSLKFYHLKCTRNIFGNLSSIKFEDLASWLMVSFVLAREVPLIFQKVSTLLALMYVVSASKEQFSLSSISKGLGEDYWSSYFHQASIGAHFTCRILSHLTDRSKSPYVEGSRCCIEETKINGLRLVPEATTDLPKCVKKFMARLPSTTIIGISLLQHEYTSLLQELLDYPTGVQAWILVSRLHKTAPFVMLLPLGSIQDDGDLSGVSDAFPMSEEPIVNWCCPWGDDRVVDDIAPAFKNILEENYLASMYHLRDTRQNMNLYWKRKKNLDHRLENLLRNFQDSFFGSWKCFLLGERLNSKSVDRVLENLVNDLRSKCKLNVNEGVLKIILREGKSLVSQSQLCSKKDCFIAKVGYCDKAMSEKIFNAAKKYKVREVEDSVKREPIILILNDEVQMLPWENLPILRNQEIYRMPSVSSIFAVLDNGSNHKEQVERNLEPFPSIDPKDAFYLINPNGDFGCTQKMFETYFRHQNIEGNAGFKPTVEELACALKKHDLFIYMGHGSGEEYICRDEILKLEKCAAALLMGCNSGSITLRGSYVPEGTPLSYLLVGSPAIVANLWLVTSADIDQFAKALLDAWYKERLGFTTKCFQCNSLAKGLARKKSQQLSESSSTKNNCSHRPTIGAFMGDARGACLFPFLTGASAVCYGVPTKIHRKSEL